MNGGAVAIPPHIVDAVSVMLRPYGVNFEECLRKSAGEDRYLTAKQAGEYCGLAAKTIRDKALSGEIRSIKIGKTEKGRVLIRKSDLDNWLAGFASRKQQQMA